MFTRKVILREKNLLKTAIALFIEVLFSSTDSLQISIFDTFLVYLQL